MRVLSTTFDEGTQLLDMLAAVKEGEPLINALSLRHKYGDRMRFVAHVDMVDFEGHRMLVSWRPWHPWARGVSRAR